MTFYNDTVQIQPNLLVLICFEHLSNTNFIWSCPPYVVPWWVNQIYFLMFFLFKERLEGYESQKTSKTPLIPNNNYSDRISLFGVGWLLGENSCCFTVSDLLQNLYNPRNSWMIFLYTGSNIFNFSDFRAGLTCMKFSNLPSIFHIAQKSK